jgi:(p)ppGpp synthase/HD superfamily hydrolase
MDVDLRELTKALAFAAEAHRNQRRKGAAQEPYLNHLIEVLDLVVQTTSDGADMDMLIAALLHDVVEDTATTYEDVVKSFGERVADIVRENSDDMSLPKAERRRARIAAMSLKSREARMVKIADVISNLRAIAGCPPAEVPPRLQPDVKTEKTWARHNEEVALPHLVADHLKSCSSA